MSHFLFIYLLIFRDHASSGNPFVLTSAMQRSFEKVSLAVSQKWPVLSYGPSGSGKTSLISKLAQLNSERQGNSCLLNYILHVYGSVWITILRRPF